MQLTDRQRGDNTPEHALLIVGVTPGSPSANAGLMVGDLLTQFDGHSVRSPEDLLDLLVEDRIGRTVALSLMRGAAALDVTLTVGERAKVKL